MKIFLKTSFTKVNVNQKPLTDFQTF